MENIGAEVGQKMRSAIKAKLLELDCYVDDELPDYIMVMVANKRSRTQMTEDLNLFLSKKTSAFVNWLHIVLKKLREVSVTNPEVYKKVAKRKSLDSFDLEINEKKTKHEIDVKKEDEIEKSLTDNLPIRNVHFGDKKIGRNPEISNITEVISHTNQELEGLQRRINVVTSHIGTTGEDEQQSYSNEQLLQRTPQLFVNKYRTVESRVQDDEVAVKLSEHDNKVEDTEMQTDSLCEKKTHCTITFENIKTTKKIAVHDRLGERIDVPKNLKIKLSEFRREEENLLSCHQDFTINDKLVKKQNSHKGEIYLQNGTNSPTNKNIHNIKSGIVKTNTFNARNPLSKHVLNKLEVMSKVYVPHKKNEYEQQNKREVKSVVQVKPRIISPNVPQPNKKLLLKAMAEAQKSIEQASKPKTAKFEVAALLRKEIKPKDSVPTLDANDMYISKKEQLSFQDTPNYISSLRGVNQVKSGTFKEESMPEKQDFITHTPKIQQPGLRKSAKLRLQKRISPPIVLDKFSNKRRMRIKTTEDTLIRPAVPFKIRERCKFWPTCRQGVGCEFVHPDINCENFPHCNYGDKCLYLHPPCKFGTSCTKRKCPFSHVTMPGTSGK